MYKIVYDQPNKNIEDTVNTLMLEGWKPLGGVAIGSGGGLVQALVKYNEDEGENS